jgi:hypothetical protein
METLHASAARKQRVGIINLFETKISLIALSTLFDQYFIASLRPCVTPFNSADKPSYVVHNLRFLLSSLP